MDSKKYYFFQKNIDYREEFVECNTIRKIFEIRNINVNRMGYVPDGNIDILLFWDNEVPTVWVVMNNPEGKTIEIPKTESILGIRFNTGMLPSFLQNLVDTQNSVFLSMETVTNVPKLLYELKEDMCFEVKKNIIMRVIDTLVFPKTNPMILKIIKLINDNKGVINIEEVADSAGYCRHYLERIFKIQLGISIKKYACIVRFQKGVEYVLLGRNEEIFNELHYYDQAHFIHDFKKFSRLTPSDFREKHNSRQMYLV